MQCTNCRHNLVRPATPLHTPEHESALHTPCQAASAAVQAAGAAAHHPPRFWRCSDAPAAMPTTQHYYTQLVPYCWCCCCNNICGCSNTRQSTAAPVCCRQQHHTQTGGNGDVFAPGKLSSSTNKRTPEYTKPNHPHACIHTSTQTQANKQHMPSVARTYTHILIFQTVT